MRIYETSDQLEWQAKTTRLISWQAEQLNQWESVWHFGRICRLPRAVMGELNEVYKISQIYLSGTGPLIKESVSNYVRLIRANRAM